MVYRKDLFINNKAEYIDMYVKEFYNEDRKDTEKGEEIWKF